MLGLEIMSLFLLGLLGAAIPAAGSGDDDDDKPADDSSEPETPAPAAEESEGEGASLLDYAVADEAVASEPVSEPVEDDSAAAEPDPWEQEAEDAALEEDLGAEQVAPEPAADLDVLAAIARLTAAVPPAAGAAPEPAADEPEDTAGLEQQVADAGVDLPDDTVDDDTADDLTDIEDDADAPAQASDDLTATTIVGYQPGSDQIEITIFAPAPDTAVDVVLQQTSDGTGTEVLIEGKLRAILDGVLPGDVDANDLYIEFAG